MRRFLLLAVIVSLAGFVLLAVLDRRGAEPALLPGAERTGLPAQPPADTSKLEAEAPRQASMASAPANPSPGSASAVPKTICRLHGTLRLVGSGEPIPARRLHLTFSSMLSALEGQYAPGQRGLPEETTMTDDTGRFAFDLPIGVRLDALRVGYSFDRNRSRPALRATLLDLKLQRLTDDLELDVWAQPAPSLTVRVREAESGAPIPGAQVVLDEWNRSSAMGLSKADGVCQIQPRAMEGMGRNRISVSVHHAEFAPQTRSLPAFESILGELSVEFALTRGQAVEGRLLGPANEPLAGLSVSLRPGLGAANSGAQELSESLETRSDRDGKFRFPAVRPFESAWLVVPARQRDPLIWYGGKRVEIRPDSARELVIHLDLEVSIEVLARFPDGTLADRGELQLACARPGEDSFQPTDAVFLACPTGTAVRILARGWKRALGEQSPRYAGETTRTFSFDPEHAARVELQLTLDPQAADPGPSSRGMQSKLRVQVRNVPNDAPDSLAIRVNGEFREPRIVEELSGRLVSLRSGWNVIEVGAPGYRPRSFELFVSDRDPSPLVLDLEPLP